MDHNNTMTVSISFGGNNVEVKIDITNINSTVISLGGDNFITASLICNDLHPCLLHILNQQEKQYINGTSYH